MSRERVRVAARRPAQSCAYCAEGLEGVLAYCGRCGARYHSECWTENRGCGSVGCAMRARPRGAPRPPEPAALSPRDAIDPDGPVVPWEAVPLVDRGGPARAVVHEARGRVRAAGGWARALMVTAVAVHTAVPLLLLGYVWLLARDRPPPRSLEPWLALGRDAGLVALVVSYLLLVLHAERRIGTSLGSNDRRGSMLVLMLVPFSGAIYWALWGRREE